MANVKDITRESWILNTFPEWGTWLNEEIEEEVVPENNFAMWWLGNCGVWIKTPGGANIVMDLWSNRGKSTKKVKDMVWGHQMANMAGVRKLQPNLRVQPMVIDPFAINELDYYLVSHFHSDHIDINTAAAIVNNPKVLIADEPTGNLDPDNSWEIMNLLERINLQGTTVLMATHNSQIVNTLRHRVIAIENGRVVRDEAKGEYGYDD